MQLANSARTLMMGSSDILIQIFAQDEIPKRTSFQKFPIMDLKSEGGDGYGY